MARYKEGYIVLLKCNLSSHVLECIYALENVPIMCDAWNIYTQCFNSKLHKYQGLCTASCILDMRAQNPNPMQTPWATYVATPPSHPNLPVTLLAAGPQPIDIDHPKM